MENKSQLKEKTVTREELKKCFKEFSRYQYGMSTKNIDKEITNYIEEISNEMYSSIMSLPLDSQADCHNLINTEDESIYLYQNLKDEYQEEVREAVFEKDEDGDYYYRDPEKLMEKIENGDILICDGPYGRQDFITPKELQDKIRTAIHDISDPYGGYPWNKEINSENWSIYARELLIIKDIMEKEELCPDNCLDLSYETLDKYYAEYAYTQKELEKIRELEKQESKSNIKENKEINKEKEKKDEKNTIKLRKIKKKDLKKILEKHERWLHGEEGGERADLSNVDLRGVDLNGAELSYANLSGANLSKADLNNADLGHVDLSGANLSNASLNSVWLSNANLRDANLSNARLSVANLSGVDFSNANLNSAKLLGADLSGANLSNVDLGGADLNYASLRGTDLSNADLQGAELIEADLHETNLDNADLYNTDLNGANLSNEKEPEINQERLQIAKNSLQELVEKYNKYNGWNEVALIDNKTPERKPGIELYEPDYDQYDDYYYDTHLEVNGLNKDEFEEFKDYFEDFVQKREFEKYKEKPIDKTIKMYEEKSKDSFILNKMEEELMKNEKEITDILDKISDNPIYKDFMQEKDKDPYSLYEITNSEGRNINFYDLVICETINRGVGLQKENYNTFAAMIENKEEKYEKEYIETIRDSLVFEDKGIKVFETENVFCNSSFKLPGEDEIAKTIITIDKNNNNIILSFAKQNENLYAKEIVESLWGEEVKGGKNIAISPSYNFAENADKEAILRIEAMRLFNEVKDKYRELSLEKDNNKESFNHNKDDDFER